MKRLRGSRKGPWSSVSSFSANGIFNSFDIYSFRLSDSWPQVPPSVRIVESKTTMTEDNDTVSFDLFFVGLDTGEEISYSFIPDGNFLLGEDDFSSSTSGSIVVPESYQSSLSITTNPDTFDEGTENFVLEISSSSAGVIGVSQTIQILDTSTGGGSEPLPPGIDVSSAFFNFDEYINNDDVSNTSANYSVSEIAVDATGSKRIYIGHKTTSSTTFYSDAPIACVQVLNPSGTSVLNEYWFGTTSTSWETQTDGTVTNTEGVGMTPAEVSAYSYTGISIGSSRDRFNLASSTGSSLTGAADGIANPTGSPLVVGEKTMPQSFNTYYLYKETSGSTLNEISFCRSPVINFSPGYIIRIAYIVGNNSGSSQELNDVFFIGVY